MDYLLSYPELIEGRLIRRYQRFLADVELCDGSLVTAHCANPGRMTSCLLPDGRVWLSQAAKPGRKLAYTLELTKMPGSLVMVNPLRAGALARAALTDRLIPELSGYSAVQSEVRLGPHSRLDFRLDDDCWIEVKSCTLVENGLAQFPDAPSLRARRHLDELIKVVGQGQRGVMLYLVGRSDAALFSPAAQVDPAYAAGLKAALAVGVEALVYSLDIDLRGLRLGRRLPLEA